MDPAGVAEDSEVDAMEEMVVVCGLGWGIGFHLLRGSCSFFCARTVSKSVVERNEPAVGGSALEVIVPSNLTPSCGQWDR